MSRILDILRTPFGFLVSTSRKEELVVEYVIREHHRGRRLDEILDDKYITNRCSPAQVARLLDHPELVRAVGDDVIAAQRKLSD